MMPKQLLLIFLTSFIAFFGCSKAKSDKWIVCEIELKDALSAAPVDAKFELYSIQSSLIGQSSVNYVCSGQTDGSGLIKLEKEVAKNDDNFYLKIFPTGFYTDLIDPQNSYTTIHLSKNSKNQRIEYLQPTYPFVLNAKSVNCTNFDDSLWVTTEGHTSLIVGCFDIEVVGPYGGSDGPFGIGYLQNKKNLEIQLITKKSGLLDTNYLNFNLQPAQITTVEFNY